MRSKFVSPHPENNLKPGRLLIGMHTWRRTFKNMARKCWDKDNFVALICHLGEPHPEVRFLLVTAPSHEEVNHYIAICSDHRVRPVREANLRRALAILGHCSVFISNDSGVMHLAAAAGVPVAGLFGPTDWWRLHPWSARHMVVSRKLPCSPHFYHSSRALRCGVLTTFDFACMREITVDEVFKSVQRLRSSEPLAMPTRP